MWQWLKRAGQYVTAATRRLLGTRDQRRVSDLDLDRHSDNARELADQLAAGTITLDEWHAAMRTEIKNTYIQQYLLARGGVDQMTPQDWGSVGGMVADQYRYLDRFAHEIARAAGAALAGAGLTVLAIAMRSRMYTNSGRQAFEKAQARTMALVGKGEVRWTLGVAEHCPGCVEFAALGWRKVADNPYNGAVPGDGTTECVTNCKCHLEYR